MLLAVRLWLGRKLYGTLGDPGLFAGVRVGRKRMIKLNCERAEVEAMQYVAAKTNVPVPKVYRVYSYRGRLAIEMEFFPQCEHLLHCWRQHLSPEQHAYVRQLRALPPDHPDRISSSSGGPCRSVRVAHSCLIGPFDNCAAFYDCLRGGLTLEDNPDTFGDAVRRVHKRPYHIKFTHADLGAQNILVRGGKVVAIVDRECAGWYPEYWE